jgi:NodT family efflux transporter outer membrane factor (OMF) lipoprotein
MKNIFSSYLFILTVAIFVACNITKDVAAPKADVPEAFRNSQSTDTASIADLPVKDFFQDDVLHQLIDSAIAKNYDMQIAVKNIEASKLLLQQVKWNYVPTVSLQATAGINRPSDNSVSGLSTSQFLGKTHIEDYTIGAAISWEADIWNKIKNKQKAALAAYLQTEEAKNAVQTEIVAQLSNGFYNLLMLRSQLAITQKNLALSDSTIKIMGFQFDAGQITSLAIQQITAQRLQIAGLVPELQQNITLQENAIRVLAGDLPSEIVVKAPLETMQIRDNASAGVPAGIVGRRPDVRIAQLDLDVANAAVGIAKANMYPSLTITAQGGLNSFKASNWFNIPASLFGAVAGGITQPLLQKKQLKTNYAVAKIEREKSVLRFRQSVLYAVGEVSDALVKIEKLKAQELIIRDRVSTLQNAIGNADLLFKTGMANYLEVITAQSNVLQSELELAAVTRARLSAVTELYAAAGGGWK